MPTLLEGKFYTMRRKPGIVHEVLVDENGVVLALGNDALTQASELEGVQWARMGGKCVVPGLVDYHSHMLFVLAEGGGDLAVLKKTRPDELMRTLGHLLKDQMEEQQSGTVIFTNWSTSVVSPAQMKQVVDRVARSREVMVLDASWHSAVVSGALLRRVAPVIKSMQNMKGSYDGCSIHEDWVIQTLGMLQIDMAELHRRILRRERSLLRRGIVEVHDKLVLGVPLLTALMKLSQSDLLTIPIVGSVQPVMMHQYPSLVRPGLYGSHFALVGLKWLADGAFGNRKAFMCNDKGWSFTDGSVGELLLPDTAEVLADVQRWRELGGTEVNVHCIGPEAVRRTLALFEEILGQTGGGGVTVSFEHFETVRGDVGRRVAQLQISGARVRVCSQYGFNTDLVDYRDRLPPAVLEHINPYRTLQEEGVEWVGGTDGPITGDDYWGGMGMVVNRPGPEAITVHEALGACCRPLQVGDKFTAAVLDCDPFEDPNQLKDVLVLETWIGAKRVYTNPTL